MSDRFSGATEARLVDFGALGAAMSGMRGGFAEAAPRQVAAGSGPKHFRPANPGSNPTAGWDPFNAHAESAPVAPTVEEAFDAVAKARAEGFAEGMAAAGRMAAARGEADGQALAQIAAGLAAASAAECATLASHLRQTVLFLVAQLVGETGISAALLAGRIEAAVTLLANSAEPASLRLNPDDLPLLEGHLPAYLTAVSDPTIERGGFRIETRSSAIEDGPRAWLDQLAAALDRVALPDVSRGDHAGSD